MCFSTSASFGVGIALSGIGIASLRKAQEPRQYAFASIPLIFGIQQLVEGVVWLSLTNPSYALYEQGASYAFLIFAQAVWPIWVPFSILLLEEDKKRKKILAALVGTGSIVAIFLLYHVFSEHATAEIRDYNIHYNLGVPSYYSIFPGLFYLISTVIPPYISTGNKMKWLAWSSLASFLVSVLYFEQNLVSVWCFFAAVISGVVLIIMSERKITIKALMLIPIDGP